MTEKNKKILKISAQVLLVVIIVYMLIPDQWKSRKHLSLATGVDGPEIPAPCDTANPFNPGTAPFEGFEWAELHNTKECEGNSESFLEGCQEFLRQTACKE